MNKITLITDGKNRMEDSALEQLKRTAELPDMICAVGLPDLHSGKTPVGAVFTTENRIYPHLIGNDIGCGMSLFSTAIERKKVKFDRLVKKAEALVNLSDVLISDHDRYMENPIGPRLGSIGGGNHFAELQEVDTLTDPEAFGALGLKKDHVMLLVHSGSRGYGQRILEQFSSEPEFYKGISGDSPLAVRYMMLHGDALNWASVNRSLIALRLLNVLGLGSAERCIDIPHNFLEKKATLEGIRWIHRKGAAPADVGPVVIPGSRGSLTYLVMPAPDTEIASWSLAHGAGRKWERGMCKSRLESKFTREALKQSRYKSRVICSNAALYEEAPEAYKNIDEVIRALESFGLIRTIATLKPILTYKG